MRRLFRLAVESTEKQPGLSSTQDEQLAQEDSGFEIGKQQLDIADWQSVDSAVSLQEEPDGHLCLVSMSSERSGEFSEGFALRIRDKTDRKGERSDLGIDSDSDETLKSSESSDSCSPSCSLRPESNLSDSAVSSNQTSLASSVTTDKPAIWLTVTNESGQVSENDAELKSPDERRQSYRRASSLKSSRAVDEAASSRQKKAVRFADALGLDLTAVKQLMDAEFANPPSWCQPKADLLTRKILRPVFDQPSSRLGSAFRQHVLDQTVCLENLLVNDLTMIGSVRVANISFEKRVFVRFTTDCWMHVADKEATYVPLSCDGQTDRFSFTITAPADINQYGLAEFSVCYVANGSEHWDNNNGRNYMCEVVTEELGAPYGADSAD